MKEKNSSSKYDKMYLVPMDVYNELKSCATSDTLTEMEEANENLTRNDFFLNTIKNTKVPHESLKNAQASNLSSSNLSQSVAQSTLTSSSPITPNPSNTVTSSKTLNTLSGASPEGLSPNQASTPKNLRLGKADLTLHSTEKKKK